MKAIKKTVLILLLFGWAIPAFSQASGTSEVGPDISSQLLQPSQVLIYWDASLSMQRRNLKNELAFLENYLSGLQTDPEVRLIVFSYGRRQDYRVGNAAAASRAIANRVGQVDYHGFTDFGAISHDSYPDNAVILLFSDGRQFGWEAGLEGLPPIICVSSTPDANAADLAYLARQTSGKYVNLFNNAPQTPLAAFTANEVVERAKETPLVYGVVHSQSGPIAGAEVRVKNSFTQVTTAANGMYRIPAQPGDELEIRAFGMKLKDTMVGIDRKMHIPMEIEGELLDDVVVTGKKSDNETVKTAFGEAKKGAVGYSLSNRITAKDIRADQVELWQIMQKMQGVVVVDPTSPNPRFKFRRTQTSSITGSTFPAIVVDGVVFDQSQQEPPFINTQMIESITLVKSMMATNRYGQLGAAGAIVIELKKGNDAPVDDRVTLAPVKGNDFNEQLSAYTGLSSGGGSSAVSRTLMAASNLDEAREQYHRLLQKQESLSVNFFLDAAAAMQPIDPEYAASILFNIAEIAPSNNKALKSLAYALEERGLDKEATVVYEQLVNLAPEMAQSYLDLARNYKEVGRYQLAATLYRQMLANSISRVDFNGLGETVSNELKQLVSLYKSKIDYQGLPPEFLKVGYKQDIRIVVEWNDPMADFELQFVSPQKKYFQLSHSVFGDKEQIKQEIAQGYSIMEFAIDDAEPGQWMVNLDYNGDRDPLNPTVLKYTVYTNYGLKNQKKVVRAVRLQDLSSKVVLDSFVY
jgi:tetratricopeptide (TPR) repeat protein